MGGGLPRKHLISAVSTLCLSVSEELRRGKERRDEQAAKTAFLANLLRICRAGECICRNEM